MKWCLGALAAALLTVGVTSHTPVRHLFQALPALCVLVLSLRRVPWASDAALPIFTVWLIDSIAAHVRWPLAVVVGGAALVGLPLAARSSSAPWPLRLSAALAFAVMQLAVIYLSLATRISRI